jgi:hypothetical protein
MACSSSIPGGQGHGHDDAASRPGRGRHTAMHGFDNAAHHIEAQAAPGFALGIAGQEKGREEFRLFGGAKPLAPVGHLDPQLVWLGPGAN